jgi:hypothetical protein
MVCRLTASGGRPAAAPEGSGSGLSWLIAPPVEGESTRLSASTKAIPVIFRCRLAELIRVSPKVGGLLSGQRMPLRHQGVPLRCRIRPIEGVDDQKFLALNLS